MTPLRSTLESLKNRVDLELLPPDMGGSEDDIANPSDNDKRRESGRRVIETLIVF